MRKVLGITYGYRTQAIDKSLLLHFANGSRISRILFAMFCPRSTSTCASIRLRKLRRAFIFLSDAIAVRVANSVSFGELSIDGVEAALVRKLLRSIMEGVGA
jgi:hypothetical protein